MKFFYLIVLSTFSLNAAAIAPAPVAGQMGILPMAALAMLATVAGVRYLNSKKDK